MTEFHYVQVVTALNPKAGGGWLVGQEIRFSSRRSAQDAAEALQLDFDEDCDPKRAYVLGPDLVPVEAAGRSKMSPMKSIRRA